MRTIKLFLWSLSRRNVKYKSFTYHYAVDKPWNINEKKNDPSDFTRELRNDDLLRFIISGIKEVPLPIALVTICDVIVKSHLLPMKLQEFNTSCVQLITNSLNKICT